MITISILYIVFFVPETRSRTLEEIDKLFGTASIAAADAARKARIKSKIRLLALVGVKIPKIEKGKKIKEISYNKELVRGVDSKKSL